MMTLRRLVWNVPMYALALLPGLFLKIHYSRASVDELAWILWPTAKLVGWATGLDFVRDGTLGYVNGASGIAIAPACSGVNFLIIAHAMAFFSFAGRIQNPARQAGWIVLCLAGAYLLTLFVNGLRIIVSIATIRNALEAGWLTFERIHRIEGIVVYFLFLCLYYLALDRLTADRAPGGLSSGNSCFFMAGPLFWYVSVALAVPVLTGNYRRVFGRFVEHGVTVFLVCPGILGVIMLLRYFAVRKNVRLVKLSFLFLANALRVVIRILVTPTSFNK